MKTILIRFKKTVCKPLLLSGLSFLLFSCLTPVEKNIKKYQGENKTILSSSLDRNVNYDYIIFSDENGVYLDNLESVVQMVAFNKTYPLYFVDMNFSCDNYRLETAYEECGESGLRFTREFFENRYFCFPIGDWATILYARDFNEYQYQIIKWNDSDTLYIVDEFEEWHSRYRVQYEEEQLTFRYNDVDENGEERVRYRESESSHKDDGYDDITAENSKSKEFIRFKQDIDYLEDCVIKPWLSNDVLYWLRGEGPTAFTVEAVINKKHRLDNPVIQGVSFTNIPSCEFKKEEIGTPYMFEKVAGCLQQEYDEYLETEKQKRIAEIQKEAIYLEDFCKTYIHNPFKTRRKYPAGHTYLFEVEIDQIGGTSIFSGYNYRLYPEYLGIQVNAYIYTNDKKFVELNYPRYVYMNAEFQRAEENWDGTWDFTFGDAELVLYKNN